MAVALLVVFRALALRRVLVDQLYRRRALWTGIGAMGVIGIIVSYSIDTLASEGYGILANATTALIVEDISWGLSFLALYGWIFSNINVALSSDFLHRDALLWNRGVRNLFVLLIFVPYVLASLPPTLASQDLVNAFSDLIGLVFAAATAYAALVLGITFRRIKDRLIRNYIKWVGLCLLGVFLWIITGGYGLPAIIFAAYMMYRAAGSLAIKTHKIDSA